MACCAGPTDGEAIPELAVEEGAGLLPGLRKLSSSWSGSSSVLAGDSGAGSNRLYSSDDHGSSSVETLAKQVVLPETTSGFGDRLVLVGDPHEVVEPAAVAVAAD
ncbi:hypothetical protein V7S43_000769 [Phytophthora oleae]|uniref:Uncharacterized protein n=1 Tax=Phytophthora oleae TaxID=2107226 RepID=A0ABD3G790_9STRA